jgi:hypothetical protein
MILFAARYINPEQTAWNEIARGMTEKSEWTNYCFLAGSSERYLWISRCKLYRRCSTAGSWLDCNKSRRQASTSIKSSIATSCTFARFISDALDDMFIAVTTSLVCCRWAQIALPRMWDEPSGEAYHKSFVRSQLSFCPLLSSLRAEGTFLRPGSVKRFILELHKRL